MAKSVSNAVLDAALSKVATAVKLVICSAEPTTYTQANATYALADVAVDSGDFVIADGDTSGRKLTIGAQADVPVDTTGTASHLALVDATDLLYVTTLTSSQPLTAGNTISTNSWKIEIADPA